MLGRLARCKRAGGQARRRWLLRLPPAFPPRRSRLEHCHTFKLSIGTASALEALPKMPGMVPELVESASATLEAALEAFASADGEALSREAPSKREWLALAERVRGDAGKGAPLAPLLAALHAARRLPLPPAARRAGPSAVRTRWPYCS